MSSTVLGYMRDTFIALKDDPDLLEPFIQRFNEQPLFVPTVDPAGLPAGKIGILFTGLDEFPDMPVLVATLDQASAQQLFQLDAERIIQVNGALMLGMVRENRFVLVINEGEDSESFEYERLLILAQARAMFAGDGIAEDDEAVARKAYPDAFVAWLYDYCHGQPDISEAWLAMVSIGSKGKPDVYVLFDDAATASHELRVKQQAHLLLPGQMLLDRAQLERDAHDGDDRIKQIRMCQPLYKRTHKQGWWARLQRRRKPAPVVWLRINLRE